MFVTNASGWYAARLFLGLAESGFIPGGLYILSTWYVPNELTQRTAVFFLGPALAGAFGSLVSAGALTLHEHRGLRGWQWLVFMLLVHIHAITINVEVNYIGYSSSVAFLR